MEFLSTDLDIFLRLITATLLGMLLGIERIFAHKIAGLRTYALVALGASLFVIISEIVSFRYIGLSNFDPIRMASQIVMGVGFLGGGLIVFNEAHVRNLTTAAGLWTAAGIGVASGFGLYSLAVFATILTLLIFTIFWHVEKGVKHIAKHLLEDEDEAKVVPTPAPKKRKRTVQVKP